MLLTARSSAKAVGYLESGRIYRKIGNQKAQLEVGREGDVDKLAHLAWSGSPSVQYTLAAHAGQVVPVRVRTVAEHDYVHRILLPHKDAHGVIREPEIGQLSGVFRSDIGKLWNMIDSEGILKPAHYISHLYLVAVGTVGLTEHERSAVKQPFSRSALALAPVAKGFSMIRFHFRKTGGFKR